MTERDRHNEKLQDSLWAAAKKKAIAKKRNAVRTKERREKKEAEQAAKAKKAAEDKAKKAAEREKAEKEKAEKEKAEKAKPSGKSTEQHRQEIADEFGAIFEDIVPSIFGGKTASKSKGTSKSKGASTSKRRSKSKDKETSDDNIDTRAETDSGTPDDDDEEEEEIITVHQSSSRSKRAKTPTLVALAPSKRDPPKELMEKSDKELLALLTERLRDMLNSFSSMGKEQERQNAVSTYLSTYVNTYGLTCK